MCYIRSIFTRLARRVVNRQSCCYPLEVDGKHVRAQLGNDYGLIVVGGLPTKRTGIFCVLYLFARICKNPLHGLAPR
jgi:hypothetical protein